MTARLLLLAVPGGALLYAASFLLRCRHRHEMWDRADGVSVLRCADCFRERPNILAEVAPGYRRTQERGNPSARSNGSASAVDAEKQAAEVNAAIEALERRNRYAEIGARVRRKQFRVIGGNGDAA